MFAQSLLEYGVLGTLITSVEGAFDAARNWADQSPEQVWVLIGALAVLIIIWSRSSRR